MQALAPKSAPLAAATLSSAGDASAEPSWTPAPTLEAVAAGGTLTQGHEGPAVASVQELLKVAVTGRFDARTAEMVEAFQLVNGLGKPTGKVGSTTLKALRKKSSIKGKEAELRADIVEVAREELGTREKGDNGGDALKYQKYFKRGPEQWCADFVSWVYTHAGKKMNQSSVTQIVRELKKSKRWKTSKPVPGDMVVFDWDGDGLGDHIGLVESVDPKGTVRTIEGNTPHPTTRKEGVWRKERSKSVILGYGRP